MENTKKKNRTQCCSSLCALNTRTRVFLILHPQWWLLFTLNPLPPFLLRIYEHHEQQTNPPHHHHKTTIIIIIIIITKNTCDGDRLNLGLFVGLQSKKKKKKKLSIHLTKFCTLRLSYYNKNNYCCCRCASLKIGLFSPSRFYPLIFFM
jgi:hypothetical protein